MYHTNLSNALAWTASLLPCVWCQMVAMMMLLTACFSKKKTCSSKTSPLIANTANPHSNAAFVPRTNTAWRATLALSRCIAGQREKLEIFFAVFLQFFFPVSCSISVICPVTVLWDKLTLWNNFTFPLLKTAPQQQQGSPSKSRLLLWASVGAKLAGITSSV